MVVTVDELEKAGYAQRRPSGTDRRARIIAVTPAGEKIAGDGQAIVDRVHGDLLSALPEGQREQFVDALVHLLDGPLTAATDFGRPVRRARQKVR
jgi:DNA-binding MarR family transcriptional regulator